MIILAVVFIVAGVSAIVLRKLLVRMTLSSMPYRLSRWKPSAEFYQVLALLVGVLYVLVGLVILGAELL